MQAFERVVYMHICALATRYILEILEFITVNFKLIARDRAANSTAYAPQTGVCVAQSWVNKLYTETELRLKIKSIHDV